MIEKYINRETVIRLLIKQRCKIAAQTNKCNVLYSVVKNYNTDNKSTDQDRKRIFEIFPHRNQWVIVGRKKDENGKYKGRKSKNQVDRNQKSLWFTYLKAKLGDNTQEWYGKLINYADEIVKKALSDSYSFSKPTVKAIEKEKDKKQNSIICRPICSFGLEDRLIASLYNKCLTNVFDNLFYEKSFAFRICQKDDHTFAHLKAVKIIKKFRQTHKNEKLWVAECDMKSFYDTIDHEVIKT